MKKWVVAFFIFVFLIIGAFVFMIYKNESEKNKISWKVEIIHEYINVRDKASTDSTVIGKAYQGNVYPVISVNLDHPSYVWYEIEYRKGQSGWIASERNIPYVKEYNNPHFKENNEDKTVEDTYEIDYIKTDENGNFSLSFIRDYDNANIKLHLSKKLYSDQDIDLKFIDMVNAYTINTKLKPITLKLDADWTEEVKFTNNGSDLLVESISLMLDEEIDNGYIITVKPNYSNNRELVSEKVYIDNTKDYTYEQFEKLISEINALANIYRKYIIDFQKFLDKLPKDGFAILNADDKNSYDLFKNTSDAIKSRILIFNLLIFNTL